MPGASVQLTLKTFDQNNLIFMNPILVINLQFIGKSDAKCLPIPVLVFKCNTDEVFAEIDGGEAANGERILRRRSDGSAEVDATYSLERLFCFVASVETNPFEAGLGSLVDGTRLTRACLRPEFY